MSFSDEILMAYADGELDELQRSRVERAMRDDPAVAAAVARHHALRRDVSAAFAGVLSEPVPQRLTLVSGNGSVLDLGQARAARQKASATRRWSWPQWGAMAASLVVGILVGSVGWRGTQDEAQLASLSANGGVPVAQGKLAAALSQQLASAGQVGQGVQIGVSFLSKEGSYCRSFILGSAAGLACRAGQEWRIPVLEESSAASAGGAYRQAGSQMPAAVLDAIDQRIEGAALDANAERAALQRGWRR
jgi:hypothetical protein